MKGSVARPDLGIGEATEHLELPLVLVDLDDLTVQAISSSGVKHLLDQHSPVVGRSIIEATPQADRVKVREALAALRAGSIDFYRARRHAEECGDDQWTTRWVRAVQFGARRLALVELAQRNDQRQSTLVEYFGTDPVDMVVGTADFDWAVISISSEINAVLGITADEFVGRRLTSVVDKKSANRLVEADRSACLDVSVALPVRMRDRLGVWKSLRCVLTSLAEPKVRWFILMPDPRPMRDAHSERLSQLERHLWSIAGEIEASGILLHMHGAPNPDQLPQAASLSLRQWDVLNRLLRGERVPSIAAELFVSQSTVRNHLSAIFQRFGVHSQAELIALLRGSDISPT